jgi:hypothetical protein
MKTRKLKCVVTGKVLFATKDYYDRKLAAHDDDPEKLAKSYICKEAKKLIKQGYSIESIREMLNVDIVSDVDDTVINEIINDNKSYLRGRLGDQVPGLVNNTVHRTDPAVKDFIERITVSNK